MVTDGRLTAPRHALPRQVECALSTDGYSGLIAPRANYVSLFEYLAVRFDDVWVGLDERAPPGLTNRWAARWSD